MIPLRGNAVEGEAEGLGFAGDESFDAVIRLYIEEETASRQRTPTP